jgi:hypothetical protein
LSCKLARTPAALRLAIAESKFSTILLPLFNWLCV